MFKIICLLTLCIILVNGSVKNVTLLKNRKKNVKSLNYSKNNIEKPPFKFFNQYISYEWMYINIQRDLSQIKHPYYKTIVSNSSVDAVNDIMEYPVIFDFFDSVLGYFKPSGEHYLFKNYISAATASSIKSVFCYSRNFDVCLKASLKIPVNKSMSRNLIMAGFDIPLKKNMKLLLDYTEGRFSRVYHNIKNVEHGFFKQLPVGFSVETVAMSGHKTISDAIKLTDTKYKNQKPKLLCVGFLPPILKHMQENLSSNLHNFLRTQQGVDLVTVSDWNYTSYWTDLAMSSFTLVECDDQTHSFRLYDAWLMRTVPVVISPNVSGFNDLMSMGFPMVRIFAWNDLSRRMLMDWYAQNYEKIDWGNVRYKMTVKYAVKNILNGY